MYTKEIRMPELKASLTYNLLKYYLILMRRFKEKLTENELNEKYPGLQWNHFVKNQLFISFRRKVEQSFV